MIKPNTEIAVRTASSGDGFVGLNINADSAEVIFPMGYHLSFEKNDMAVDIKNLILILHRFSEKKDGVLRISPGALHDVEKEIPVSPFLWILYDWKHNGYYKESESSYHSSLNGKIHWGRTIKIKKPLICLIPKEKRIISPFSFLVQSRRGWQRERKSPVNTALK